MLFLFLSTILASPIYKVDLNDLTISGSGSITQSGYQNSGSYQLYTSLTIEGPDTIEAGAFQNSMKLKSIHLGKSVTNIYDPFCRNCPELESIEVNYENSAFKIEDNILYKFDFSTVIRVPPMKKTVSINSNAKKFAQQAFQGCGCPTLVIPKGVVEIGVGCFYDTTIQQIKFEANAEIQVFGERSFSVARIINNFVVPKSVERMTEYVFENTYSMTTLTFEEGSKLNYIGTYCFIRSVVTNLIFPDSLLSIGEAAFSQCKDLEVVGIGNSLTSIANTAFSGCTGISTITVSKENQNFYMNDFALMDTKNKSIFAIMKDATYLNVPSDCTYISSTALQSLAKLTKIEIHSGNGAFETDGSIIYTKGKVSVVTVSGSVESVTLSASALQTIGEYSFYNHLAIKTVIISSPITRIGPYAFASASIQKLSIPSSIQYIEDRACQECLSLREVIIPEDNDLISIGTMAFYSSTKIATTFYVGSKFNNVATQAFDATGFVGFVFNLDCPIQTINTFALRNTKITALKFPKHIVSITTSSISNNPRLESVEFTSSTVKTLGIQAFENCPVLKSIQIPASVTTIETYCFRNDVMLSSVSFDSGSLLSSIGAGCFESCSSLSSFVLQQGVSSLEPSIFYKCTSLVTFETMDSTKFQGEDNVIYNSDKTTLIFCPAGKLSCTAASTTTTIGNNAFYGCSKLTSVDLQQTTRLGSIGSNTFYECTSLAAITIPASVSAIRSSAFKLCTSLSEVTFDGASQLGRLEADTFSGCKTLRRVIFSDAATLTSIDSSMFADSALESFFVPSSVTSLGSLIFSNCVNLTSVSFGSAFKMTTLSTGSFKGCSNLVSFNLSSSVTSIPTSCFEGCSSLPSIPNFDSVTAIGDRSFYGCDMFSLVLPKNLVSIGNYAFQRETNTKKSTEKILHLSSSITSIGTNAFVGCPISIVYYCGENKITASSAFSSGVVAYVKYNFDQSAGFLDLPTFRCLDQNCALIPPSPTGTHFFTSNGSLEPGMDTLLIAALLGESESEF